MPGVDRVPTLVITGLVPVIQSGKGKSGGRTWQHLQVHAFMALDCRDKPGNDECVHRHDEVGTPHG